MLALVLVFLSSMSVLEVFLHGNGMSISSESCDKMMIAVMKH